MKIKRKRIKIKSLIIIFSFILIISLCLFIYYNLKLKNIFVTGNVLIKESDIIDISNLKDYPNISKISTKSIKNKILDNKLVKNCDVNKTFSSVSINISEYKVILYNNVTSKYIIENGEEINDNLSLVGLPILNDKIDSTVYSLFIDGINILDKDILRSISEINYSPSEFDNERFLLLMNDQNYVYITLSKISNLNYYFDIIKEFNDKKGILYLDSGNHFIIKK